jgi:mannose-6-phosphate isomerase-like protein (cupin superfamily)
MTDRGGTAIFNLSDAIKRLVLGATIPMDTPPEFINAVIEALDSDVFEEPGRDESTRYPVLSLLDGIQACSGDDIFGRVTRALFHVRKSVHWRQNDNYKNHQHMNDYLSNSVYCELAGPRGMLKSDKTAIGFLLVGPNLEYPDHYHPASELYFPLYGTALWKRAEEGWQERSPGACIYHPSNCSHSMRTLESPLLAMSLWFGDLDTFPVPTLGAGEQ